LRLPYNSRAESKFVKTILQEILNPFDFSFGLFKLKEVPVKNLGLRLKLSIGSHTNIWAFQGLFYFLQPFCDRFI
jgi:hypothetical protein